MKSLLVIGGKGLLGQYVTARARGHHSVIATCRPPTPPLQRVAAEPLDVTDPVAINALVERIRPWGIILAAAPTAVDYCEDHPAEARAVNAQAPAAVAQAARTVGARLIHISTDYVFDGQHGSYTEDDSPAPLGVYGKTKLEGERGLLAQHPGACVVRMSALYGWNRLSARTNFATWILGELQAGREVPLWTDQVITPTYAGDAAPLLLTLLDRGAQGLFHLASADRLNRFEFGRTLAEVFDLPVAKVKASSMADARLRAARPPDSCLSVGRLRKELGVAMPTARESLRAMRAET